MVSSEKVGLSDIDISKRSLSERRSVWRTSLVTTLAVLGLLLTFGTVLGLSQPVVAVRSGQGQFLQTDLISDALASSPLSHLFAPNRYVQTNLVSDIPGLAQITDPNLVNSWGIAHPPTGPWWVADNGAGVATLYNGTGQPFPIGAPLVVTIPPPMGEGGPATPTGIVFNDMPDFAVAPDKPARFIFVTEDGTISAWNQTVDLHNAILKVNNSPTAVYKGVTIARKGNANYLYVANFRGGSVDVFDTNFNQVTLATDAFTDKKIPAGFAPFNVLNIRGKIFVTFAKQDAQKHDNLDGPGLGFVDVFDPDGDLLMRLKHGRWMNAPWGIALAPADFGRFSNHLLVGNFGSGNIAAFDPETGDFHGLLRNSSGKPVTIDGLWGLGFGNGANAGPTNTLFFAAGINDEQDGLFGTLTAVSSGESEHHDSSDSDEQ